MEDQEISKPGLSSSQTISKAKPSSPKARNDSSVLQAQVKAEQKARQKAEKNLTEAQTGLSAIQVQLDQEQQERMRTQQQLEEALELLEKSHIEVEQLHQAMDKAEQEKAEVENEFNNIISMDLEQDDSRPTSALPVEDGGKRRDSFVIRLTMDMLSQIEHTEIQHSRSLERHDCSPFDVQRMADFITEKITRDHYEEEPASFVQNDKFTDQKAQPLNPEISLAITGLQSICRNEQGDAVVIFKANRTIKIDTYFQIDDKQSRLEVTSIPYRIEVFTHEIDKQSSKLAASVESYLESGVTQYHSEMQILGLPVGLFQLTLSLKLGSPAYLARIEPGLCLQIEPD